MLDLTDHFLIAMPGMDDIVFDGSVVYVTSHSVEQGAVGVIVNKPLDRKLKNAFVELDVAEYNPQWSNNSLYLGGPVRADNGFVLRPVVSNDVVRFELTNDRRVLSDMAANHIKDLFISVGYTSWSALQIEDEIYHNNWLVLKADPQLLFAADARDRYSQALKMLGINDVSSLYRCDPAFV